MHSKNVLHRDLKTDNILRLGCLCFGDDLDMTVSRGFCTLDDWDHWGWRGVLQGYNTG